MKALKLLFREIRSEVQKIVILESLIDTSLFFLAAHTVLTFFGVHIIVSALLTAAFLFFTLNRISDKYILKDIEDANPQVKEMLRTAKDNIRTENVMTGILAVDLIDKIKTAQVGKVMRTKSIIQKIAAICVLSFVMIVVVTFDVQFSDIPDIFAGEYGGTIPSIELNESDDIFGDIKIAKLGDKELEVKINPTLSELDFTKVKDAEEIPQNFNDFPVDVGVEGSEASQEGRPDEFMLAKQYNLELRKMGD